MIMAIYRFHIYYHVRRILKKLQVPLPHETGFNTADNPYTESEFLKICEDYTKNFIGLISVAFIGLMITLARTQ